MLLCYAIMICLCLFCIFVFLQLENSLTDFGENWNIGRAYDYANDEIYLISISVCMFIYKSRTISVILMKIGKGIVRTCCCANERFFMICLYFVCPFEIQEQFIYKKNSI